MEDDDDNYRKPGLVPVSIAIAAVFICAFTAIIAIAAAIPYLLK